MFAATGLCIRIVGHKLGAPDPSTLKPGMEIPPLVGVLLEGLNFLVVLLLTWIMSKIERRPNSVYGFGGRRKLAHFSGGSRLGSYMSFAACVCFVEERTSSHR